jgi:hypothetical protein
MTDTTRALALLHEVMGIVGEDTLLPLTVLVNLHRVQLAAPLERMLTEFGGRATEPGLRVSRAMAAVDERWPVLVSGAIFEQDEELDGLQDQLPSDGIWDDETVVAVARNPSPELAKLLLLPYSWLNCEPLLLLHTLTWTNTDAAQVPILLQMLAREMELTPAVEDLIRQMTAMPHD